MATTDESNGVVVRITLRDVYDKLLEVSDKVTPLPDRTVDHEQRIRTLEKWAYGIPLSMLLAFGAAAASLIERLAA